jgi:hypothetical protein
MLWLGFGLCVFTPPLQQRGWDIRCPRPKKDLGRPPLLDQHLDLVRLGPEQLVPAQTLVVRFFTSYTKGDEGDGFSKLVSVRVEPSGQAKVVGAVDTPAED